MSPSQFFTLDGKQIEYRWVGPPPDKAPVLVFLHEGLGCAALWRDFPEKLAAATGCAALVYSRWGYGRSSSCALPRPLHYIRLPIYLSTYLPIYLSTYLPEFRKYI